jgi:hypothetical protein
MRHEARLGALAIAALSGTLGCAAASGDGSSDADEDFADESQAIDDGTNKPLVPSPADHHEDGNEDIQDKSAPLEQTDTVATAVELACTTSVVKGLATQLIEEINCLKPGAMKRIDDVSGLSLGSAVFPWLQTPAANALAAAQRARGVTMSLNSGLRTLPQQYLLYRWYKTGRCSIRLAASPGTSNHESGIAVDINGYSSWRTTMQKKQFRWLGASDPVHFDYVGSGIVSMKGLSVRAFQRLWNRNNPSDRIAEDGAYGPNTERRLAKSPIGGFATGATCGSF